MTVRYLFVILVLLLCITSALGVEIDPRIADTLNTHKEVRIIVFEDTTQLRSLSVQGEKSLASKTHTELITEEELATLEHNQNIRKVFLDREASISLDESVPLVEADKLWNITSNGTRINGSGESVCILDTGVDASHASLQGRIVAEHCFCNNCCPNGNDTDNVSTDDHGHGTHVAGIVASQDATYRGVAPGAGIVAVKVLDNNGNGFFSDILSGINWCVSNAATYNISVISMSLGDNTKYTSPSTCDTDVLADSIDAAITAGIIVVAASGNEGFTNGLAYPACDSDVTSVGSVTKSDIVVSSSNSASFLDILAPGNAITSLNDGGGTVVMSGTSMATPHVSGVAAMLQQLALAHGGSHMSPEELRSILTRNGPNITDWRNSIVKHRLDALASAADLINNTPPEINEIAPTASELSIVEPKNQSFSINASDAEGNITISWIKNGVSVGSGDAYNFTGNYSAAGTYTLSVVVIDEYEYNATHSWLLEVNNTNRPPHLDNRSPTTTNISIFEPNNQSFSINVSDPDLENLTYAWYLNGTLVGSTKNYTFLGNYSQARRYNISVIASDPYDSINTSWLLEVNNTNRVPSINMTLLPNEPTTSDDLICNYTYVDLDLDAENWTLRRWYKDGVLNSSFENITVIASSNTSKGEVWTCEVITNDGALNSAPRNLSRTILNTPPSISSHANITLRETERMNITINATDNDLDTLIYYSNDSRLLQDNNNFTWQTNLSDAGTHIVKFNVSDGDENSSIILSVIVMDAPDYDGDGNPNFNDTDDDNDGMNDTEDFVTGNVTNINTTNNLSLEINGSTNISRHFAGMLNITFKENNLTIINLTYNFTNTSPLDLYNLTINESNGSIVIRGLSTGVIGKKRVRISDYSAVTGICILDTVNPSLSAISATCDTTDEHFVLCDGTNQSNYTCTDEGAYYLITGLQHSAVQEQCIDSDGDGYLAASCGGNDCDDTSLAVRPGGTEICGDSIDQDCSGSDLACASSGGGGGGGGGGGTPEEKVESIEHTWYGISEGQRLTFNVHQENISITNLSFSAKKRAQRITMKLTEQVLNDTPRNIIPYQYLQLNDGGADELGENFTLHFRLPKTWMREQSFFGENIRFYRMESSWKEYAIEKEKDDKSYEYFSVKLPGFSLFLIGAKFEEKVVESVKEENERSEEVTTEEERVNNTITNASEEAAITESAEQKGFPWLPIGFSTFFLIILATILPLITKKNDLKEELHHLEKYVQKHIHRGHKPHAVAHHLISHGWPAHHVKSTYRKMKIPWNTPTPEERTGMHHPHKPLIAFINTCLKKGYTRKKIKAILLKTGWKEEVINKLL